MKKLFFPVIMGIALFVQCAQDDQTTASGTDSAALSSAALSIADYVAENYPDAEIQSISVASGSAAAFTAVLNTSEQLTFDSRCRFTGALKSLCDTVVVDTISTAAIKEGHGRKGGHGKGRHGHGGYADKVDADSLPTAIADYVAANFPGYAVHNGRIDTQCQFGEVYDVMIDSSRTAHHKLIFGLTGEYLALAHRVDTTAVPSLVMAAVESGYAGYTLRKRIQQLTLANGFLQYRVFMRNDTTQVSVVLNADGSINCEQ